MILYRGRPNDHTTCGMTFHPGSQFVPDEFYKKTLKDNPDFKAQIKAKFMAVEVPPVESEKGKEAKPKESLAETIVALPEDEAIALIKTIIDGVELKEISKLDKRRAVVAAAETQIEARQTAMDMMAPKIPNATGNISFGDRE